MEASLNLATSDERKEVQREGGRGGGQINRFVVGSSEGIAKTEREGEKALKGFKNAICDGSRKT